MIALERRDGLFFVVIFFGLLGESSATLVAPKTNRKTSWRGHRDL
jgi:hypothetical protein